MSAQVTAMGIRDGDPAVLEALVNRRGAAVLAYCEQACAPSLALDAAADAFTRFRATVLAAPHPAQLDPEAALLGATRHAAAARTPRPPAREATGLSRVFGGRGPGSRLPEVPDLLAARAEGTLVPEDAAALEGLLDASPVARSIEARFLAAEHAYRNAPRSALPAPITAQIVATMSTLAAAPAPAAPPLDGEGAIPVEPAPAPRFFRDDPEPAPAVTPDPFAMPVPTPPADAAESVPDTPEPAAPAAGPPEADDWDESIPQSGHESPHPAEPDAPADDWDEALTQSGHESPRPAEPDAPADDWDEALPQSGHESAQPPQEDEPSGEREDDEADEAEAPGLFARTEADDDPDDDATAEWAAPAEDDRVSVDEAVPDSAEIAAARADDAAAEPDATVEWSVPADELGDDPGIPHEIAAARLREPGSEEDAAHLQSASGALAEEDVPIETDTTDTTDAAHPATADAGPPADRHEPEPAPPTAERRHHMGRAALAPAGAVVAIAAIGALVASGVFGGNDASPPVDTGIVPERALQAVPEGEAATIVEDLRSAASDARQRRLADLRQQIASGHVPSPGTATTPAPEATEPEPTTTDGATTTPAAGDDAAAGDQPDTATGTTTP